MEDLVLQIIEICSKFKTAEPKQRRIRAILRKVYRDGQTSSVMGMQPQMLKLVSHIDRLLNLLEVVRKIETPEETAQ